MQTFFALAFYGEGPQNLELKFLYAHQDTCIIWTEVKSVQFNYIWN